MLRAASLLLQLPDDARLVRIDNPDAQWSTEAHFLRRVDYELRALIHGLGGNKGAKPTPIETPAEVERSRKAGETAIVEKDEVDSILADILNNEGEVTAGG